MTESDSCYRAEIGVDNISLHWNMGPPGSAALALHLPRNTIEIHTTYVGDGLGSVVQAALDLQLGSSSAIAFLPVEPGGTCLFFASAGDEAYLQVVDFADMESESVRWSGGSLRWHGRVGVAAFVRSVVLMAEEVLALCGSSDAYSRAWGGIPFPLRGLETLRQGL